MNPALAVALVGWTLGRSEPARPVGPLRQASPMTQLMQSTEALRACLRREYPSWSPEADLQRSALRRLIGGSMDYFEISRRALGTTWDRLSARDQTEFVSDLGKVIEGRYLNRRRSSGLDFQLRFDRQDVSRRGTASVFGTVLAQSRSKPVRVAVEYRLLWKGDHWALYDLVTDGDSMLESYRDEFDRIIARESFGGLMRRIHQQAQSFDDGR